MQFHRMYESGSWRCCRNATPLSMKRALIATACALACQVAALVQEKEILAVILRSADDCRVNGGAALARFICAAVVPSPDGKNPLAGLARAVVSKVRCSLEFRRVRRRFLAEWNGCPRRRAADTACRRSRATGND